MPERGGGADLYHRAMGAQCTDPATCSDQPLQAVLTVWRAAFISTKIVGRNEAPCRILYVFRKSPLRHVVI